MSNCGTLWRFIRRLNGEGHTIVLTTHYLEEAESYCGRIAMLQQGRVVALDTTANLLRQFSAPRLKLRLAAGEELPPQLRLRAVADGDRWIVSFDDFAEVGALLLSLQEAGCTVSEVSIGSPDLEEAFLAVMRRGAA